MILQAANLVFRFFLELCALTAISYWGFHTGSDWFIKIILGLAMPTLAAMTWGIWIAPAARYRQPDPLRLALELMIFGLAAAALATTGQVRLAWGFGLSTAINIILMFIWKQR